MKDYMTCNPSPIDEPCAQVGSEGFEQKEKLELRAYRHQLERLFPDLPEGMRFAAKHFPHDFGSYGEVVLIFDDDIEEHLDKMIEVEAGLPHKWDDEAKAELAEGA